MRGGVAECWFRALNVYSDPALITSYSPVADPGEAPPPSQPNFIDQTEARTAVKICGGGVSPSLSKGLDDRPPPPPYLKVWIRHRSQ